MSVLPSNAAACETFLSSTFGPLRKSSRKRALPPHPTRKKRSPRFRLPIPLLLLKLLPRVPLLLRVRPLLNLLPASLLLR